MLAASRSSFICLRCRTRLNRIALNPRTSTFNNAHPFSLSASTHRDRGPKGHIPSARQRAHKDYALPGETVSSMIADLPGFEPSLEQSHTLLSNPQKRGNQNIREYIAVPQKAPSSWASTGMRDAVANAITRAFSDAARTTDIQRRLLRALTSGYSVIVRDKPGRGKSFAIAAWVMTLQRALRPNSEDGKRPKLATTALILAPNTDLVEQYYSIITELIKATGSKTVTSNPDAFVQRVYRSGPEKEAAQIELLKKHPDPHILIATPTILLDFLASRDPGVRDLIDYTHIKAIVAEETDSAFRIYDRMNNSRQQKDPLIILLDYISQSRKATAVKQKLPLTQPQLVFPIAARSPNKTRRVVQKIHPSWLDGENRPGFEPFTGKGKRHNSSSIIVVSDPVTPLVQLLPDTISHHVVAYDPTSGLLRDAPLIQFSSKEEAMEALREQEEMVREEDATEGVEAVENEEESFSIQTSRTYPPDISAEVLQQLLEHDNWPANVLVGLSPEASKSAFITECAARGISAQELRFEDWNATAEDGRLPLGRSDKLVGAAAPKTEGQKEEEPRRREQTRVWITNHAALRGLDVPNISHMYILHRVTTNSEYVVYAGRVARWPFSEEEEARDPRAAGRDRRPRGKVVNVVLEESTSSSEEEFDANDLVWEQEALKLTKIDVKQEPYFREGEVIQVPQIEGDDAGSAEEGTEKRLSSKYRRHLKKRRPGFVPETRPEPSRGDAVRRRRGLIGWATKVQSAREARLRTRSSGGGAVQ